MNMGIYAWSIINCFKPDLYKYAYTHRKGKIGQRLCSVIGAYAVPIIQMLTSENFLLNGEGEHSRHGWSKHEKENSEEVVSHYALHIFRTSADVEEEQSNENTHSNVGTKAQSSEQAVTHDLTEGTMEQNFELLSVRSDILPTAQSKRTLM